MALGRGSFGDRVQDLETGQGGAQRDGLELLDGGEHLLLVALLAVLGSGEGERVAVVARGLLAGEAVAVDREDLARSLLHDGDGANRAQQAVVLDAGQLGDAQHFAALGLRGVVGLLGCLQDGTDLVLDVLLGRDEGGLEVGHVVLLQVLDDLDGGGSLRGLGQRLGDGGSGGLGGGGVTCGHDRPFLL